MKKLSVMGLILVLIVAFAGTAMADNSANLTDTTTGMRVTKGPVVIKNVGGAGTTVYVATGYAQFNNEKSLLLAAPGAGVSVFAIDTMRTNADGTLQKKELTAAMQAYANGVTLVAAPVVTSKSGTSVFYSILAPNAQVVGGLNSGTGTGHIGTDTGVTILALNGTSGAIAWQRGIAINGTVAGVATNSPYALVSPLTLDDESVMTSGATLYMAVGADEISATGTGATVYSIDADNGNILGQYTFPGVGAAGFASTVSGFFSAPFISGNSLYVLGWDKTSGGVTLYGLHRNNVNAGVSAVGLVNTANMDYSHAQTPTPAVSGNSIFVVAAGIGTQAGVTVYDKYRLNKVYFTNYGPVAAGSGVSASPVTDGTYIVLSTMSAVTCYNVNSLSTNTRLWTIDLAKSFTDGTYMIFGTPAISNGFVYIPVSDTTGANKGFILRCVLNSTTGEPTKIGNVTEMVSADPIISAGYVYAVTHNPTVHQIGGGIGAHGYNDWKQFKFDKAKTGYSFDPPQRPVEAGSSGGCFISTVK